MNQSWISATSLQFHQWIWSMERRRTIELKRKQRFHYKSIIKWYCAASITSTPVQVARDDTATKYTRQHSVNNQHWLFSYFAQHFNTTWTDTNMGKYIEVSCRTEFPTQTQVQHISQLEKLQNHCTPNSNTIQLKLTTENCKTKEDKWQNNHMYFLRINWSACLQKLLKSISQLENENIWKAKHKKYLSDV